ncbi:MAG: Mrp/NBP35 family ATP-binding protein [Desulfobacteraceae bacterium]|nr:Mrp/NBP35 family ATP-binding protein [Desulfobacteraceae bacterium]
MSGKGGVGKSSVAAGLATRLSDRGNLVGLMDIDIHGPSIAGILGIKELLDVTADQKVLPKSINDNLKAVSMQALMPNADQAVIWRGPAKTGLIRQFIGDVQWETLDYLIIDAPPGTGDEPLSVAQTISDAKAVIVTTPQEVALSDVRKSINFCKTVNMEIAGLVENMGPFDCPCCGKNISLFKSGGGKDTAIATGTHFLGSLPFDARIVKACDAGMPGALYNPDSSYAVAMDRIVDALIKRLSN